MVCGMLVVSLTLREGTGCLRSFLSGFLWLGYQCGLLLFLLWLLFQCLRLQEWTNVAYRSPMGKSDWYLSLMAYIRFARTHLELEMIHIHKSAKNSLVICHLSLRQKTLCLLETNSLKAVLWVYPCFTWTKYDTLINRCPHFTRKRSNLDRRKQVLGWRPVTEQILFLQLLLWALETLTGTPKLANVIKKQGGIPAASSEWEDHRSIRMTDKLCNIYCFAV